MGACLAPLSARLPQALSSVNVLFTSGQEAGQTAVQRYPQPPAGDLRHARWRFYGFAGERLRFAFDGTKARSWTDLTRGWKTSSIIEKHDPPSSVDDWLW